MPDATDVEPQSIVIDFDERGPAPGPMRESLNERRIARRIGGNRDERRIERPRVGQPRAGASAPFRGGPGRGMDDEAVRAFDGENDRTVRR